MVKDDGSGIPLPGVQVLLTPSGFSQVTNSDGTFQFDNLDIQEYTLTFSRTGYESYIQKVTVKPGLSSQVQVTLRVADTHKATLQMTEASELHPTWMRLTAVLSSLGDTQVTQHGFCLSTNASPTLSDVVIQLGTIKIPGSFSALAEGLTAKTTYHIRAFAQNGAGVAYSNEYTVTTPETGTGPDSSEGIAVPQGLVSYYTFEKADVSDCTDNELHGNMIGEPTFVSETPSGEGKAIFLNYIKGQYINIPYNPFKGISQYSICLWIKDFSTGMVFSCSVQGASLARSDYPRLVCQSDSRFTFYTGYDNYNDTPSFDYDVTKIQAGGWHHVALTCTASGGMLNRNLYVDGKLVATNSRGDGNTSSSASGILFGGNDGGKYSVGTSMKLDNIRFYTRALTKDEIATIYAKEL